MSSSNQCEVSEYELAALYAASALDSDSTVIAAAYKAREMRCHTCPYKEGTKNYGLWMLCRYGAEWDKTPEPKRDRGAKLAALIYEHRHLKLKKRGHHGTEKLQP